MGTVPPIPHITPSEFPTAAKLNQYETALNFLMNPPRALVQPSAAQSQTTTGLNQTIAFDGETVDTDGMHDLVTNNSRLTAQTPGKYEVWAQVSFAANATGRRTARLVVNGTAGGSFGQTEPTTNTVASGATAVVIPAQELTLNVGDFIEVQAFQSSGASLAYVTGLNTFLRAKWIGI